MNFGNPDSLAIAVGYLVLCLAVAGYAKLRGRSPRSAFIASLLSTPLLGFLVVLISLPEIKKRRKPNRLPKAPFSRPPTPPKIGRATPRDAAPRVDPLARFRQPPPIPARRPPITPKRGRLPLPSIPVAPQIVPCELPWLEAGASGVSSMNLPSLPASSIPPVLPALALLNLVTPVAVKKGGRILGTFTGREILGKIQAGELSALDQFLDPAAKSWAPIGRLLT